MTDFIRIKPNIPKTNGMAVSDVTEFVLKRPMLVPAVMLLQCCCLTYLSESALPFLISAGILVITGLIACLKRNLTLMFCVLISLLLVFLSGIRILSVLSTEIPVSSDEFHTGIVISCERKLSGKTGITAVIGGVRVDLTADNVSDPAFPAPGMCFTASGKFKEPDSPGNPGEFEALVDFKDPSVDFMLSFRKRPEPSAPDNDIELPLEGTGDTIPDTGRVVSLDEFRKRKKND